MSLSRRSFLAAGVASLSAASYARALRAPAKLRLAAVGVGGQGWSDLNAIAKSPDVEVVALCDIDSTANHLGRAAKKFAAAKTFADWRKLLDEPKSFDALLVATPDFMHAPVALPAMTLGKHVYCEKPLTHTVREARVMRETAAKHKVVTQMGNQIQAHAAYRTAVKAVHDGAVGKVKAVHSWQAGGLPWMLADDRPAGADKVPDGVSWDLWLGVAPERPFKSKLYHSFNWRAWQDFSNGQLGDFGCHILDPVFGALGLTSPTSIVAEAPPINREVWTKKATVSYVFPGTARTAGETLALTWYDGQGNLPDAKALGIAGVKLPTSGSLLVGEKGTLLIPHVGMPSVVGVKDAPKLPTVAGIDHYVTWADACRGVGKTGSGFDFSGPLTETVLLGTVAIRSAGKKLAWDAAKMTTGDPKADAMLTKAYRKGWEPAGV